MHADVSGNGQRSAPSASCPRCEGLRPAPRLDGNLRVDPEIHLPAPGMDVDIAYFYNANTGYNGPFGYARTLSTNLFLQALTTSVGEGATLTTVTLFRGNGATTRYTNQGGSSFFCLSSGFFNTLVQDSTNGVCEETTPEGVVSVYRLQSPVLGQTQLSSVSYVQDAAGRPISNSA